MDLTDEFAETIQSATVFPDIIKRFGAGTSQYALDIAKKDGTEGLLFLHLVLEARVWGLVEYLYNARQASDTDAAIYEAILVWLQEACNEPEMPSNISSVKWLYTKNRLNRANQPGAGPDKGNRVTYLDSDAPVRECRSIEKRDAEVDEVTFRYVFDLLLAGKYKEAADTSGDSSNWILKSAIQCMHEPLLTRACYGVCQTSSLSAYERAIYGFICGDTQTVLPLCTSWETQFLGYMNAIVVSVRNNKSDKEDKVLNGPSVSLTTPGKVLDALSNSSNNKISVESRSFLRVLMGSIIKNEVDELAARMVMELREVIFGGQPANVLLEDPELLRVLVHLLLALLFLHPAPHILKPDGEFLLNSYIEILVMQGKVHWVPGYLQFMTDDRRIKTYSRVLIGIADSRQRALQIQLAQRFGINIDGAITTAAEIVTQQLTKTLPKVDTLVLPPVKELPQPSPLEMQYCQTIEWFGYARMWSSALTWLVDALRLLFSAGQVRAAMFLCEQMTHHLESNGEASLDERWKELSSYVQLVRALQAIDAWDDAAKHIEGGHVGNATHIIENAVANVSELSKFLAGPGFTDSVLEKLRVAYVPYTILELVRVTREAAKLVDQSYLRQAMQLAPFIADEDWKVYELFAAGGKLGELLDAFATVELEGPDIVWV